MLDEIWSLAQSLEAGQCALRPTDGTRATIDQVRDLGLPSSPFIATEKHARRWRETLGHEQTEIDAVVKLQPEALR
jgi:hypothetical protein